MVYGYSFSNSRGNNLWGQDKMKSKIPKYKNPYKENSSMEYFMELEKKNKIKKKEK